jgi:uncharacterized protein YjbJ (UPF0337 family)
MQGDVMQIRSVELNNLRGLADKAVGLTKETIGTVIGRESLQKEGEAQQARATEELRALRAQIKAEGKDAKAQGFETQQRAAQRAKESA